MLTKVNESHVGNVLEKTPTGIEGLDELLEGGFPKNRCTLICGGPGSGKTIFSTQFLYNGIKKYGATGVLVTLAEDPVHIKEEMSSFGWDLEKLEEEAKLAIIDLSPLVYLSRKEFKKSMLGVQVEKVAIESVVKIVKDKVEELKAKRVAVDSITSLMIQEPNLVERRREIANLFKGLSEIDCTYLVTSEIHTTALERELQVEEYLAQGVILLQTIRRTRDQFFRVIQIEKMRGTAHDTQPHPYHITENGIKIFPKEKLP
jgi:KaiC/GvpD/RAD55 family RecA-like ATPase